MNFSEHDFRRSGGVVAEMEFERQLHRRGYSPVMSPARKDDGVDFVVWTAKGWVGVQVKTAQRKSRNEAAIRRRDLGAGAREYFNFDMRGAPKWVKDEAAPRGGRWVRSRRGREYYESRGVAVMAIFNGDGFYLVPITSIHGNETRLASLRWTWEAWAEILGDPAHVGGVPGIAAPADPLEQMLPLETRP